MGLARALRNARRLAGVVVLGLQLAGCAALFPQSAALRDAPPAGLPPRAELEATPFFPQEEYQCGPAALATVLAAAGARTTPAELVPQVYVPGRRGSFQVEMLAAARRQGYAAYPLAPRLEDVLREIAAGHPVVVLQDRGFGAEGWHFAVAVGYDLAEGELVLRSGTTRRETLPFPVHEYAWRKGGHWSMVALPPGRIPATAEELPWLAALAALERAGRPEAARSGYAASLERWPRSAHAAIGLANAHLALGERAPAVGALRRALEAEPDSVVALNNLAHLLSEDGRHDEALRLIERAAALGGPFAPAVRETREGVLRRAGRPATDPKPQAVPR